MKKLLRTFVLFILLCAIQHSFTANASLKITDRSFSDKNIVINKSFAVPSAPTNLRVTAINSGGIIYFTPPANDGGSSITNYEYSTDNGITWVTPSPAITSSPMIINSSLTNCTLYQVKLRALNASGAGDASAPVALTPATSIEPGIVWTSRNSAFNNGWFSVTYGNGLFVAVAKDGSGDRVMTSPDGITWTLRTPAANNSWYSVAYGNGIFVAVAISGIGDRVMTSPDGITWTSRTSAADRNWFSVTYGNGIFVAVSSNGNGNQVMTSSDGINWSIQTTPTSTTTKQWRSVTYGNGLFVAVDFLSDSYYQVMTSPDGTTWTLQSTPTMNKWKSVTYGNGLFVAVANNSASASSLMTSPDGINWTVRSSAASSGWLSVTYGNGLFVAVSNSGSGNRVMTSSDGLTWTSRASAADYTWASVTYGNGVFVAVALDLTLGTPVMTSSFIPVSDAPVITSATVGATNSTVSFTQSLPADAPAITNYQYSTDNGSNWTILSPASATSPITIDLLTANKNQIKLKAINSVGNSCPASYSVVFGLNNYGQQTSTSSVFVNKNGAVGLSGVLLTGESMDLPTLDVTTPVSNVSSTTAVSGGNVISNKGSFVTARGVCWSSSPNPTIDNNNNKTIDGNSIGSFISSISGLSPNTTYYLRSYATNSVGTSYGQVVIFTTTN